MITVSQKETEVILSVDVYPLGYVFNFRYNAGQEWAAKALTMMLSDALGSRIQYIRSKEYHEGLKDARKPKSERKQWFLKWLDK